MRRTRAHRRRRWIKARRLSRINKVLLRHLMDRVHRLPRMRKVLLRPTKAVAIPARPSTSFTTT